MQEFIGEARYLTGTELGVNVLGNHLPKDNPGWNPCIQLMFDSNEEAFKHYCKGYKITVEKDRVRPSEKHTGFVVINAKDCTMTELTHEEVVDLVKEYKIKYEGEVHERIN
jgi:hypothetical protein